jgi:ribosomal protein RSM22 (predicted rRNA methylase)
MMHQSQSLTIATRVSQITNSEQSLPVRTLIEHVLSRIKPSSSIIIIIVGADGGRAMFDVRFTIITMVDESLWWW